ncbi:hypothetical protein [Brumimicrobium mesophilum]|uniref:hypothetical protein n=1 Tax=Brumimicrobium mesophilum TaxID=392717 RepID=UPI000D1421C4|nr:hypothetical protein [Brumimicrobium mesophilum]
MATLSQLQTAADNTQDDIDRFLKLANDRTYVANQNFALAQTQAAWLASKSNSWKRKNGSEIARVNADNVRLINQSKAYKAEAEKIRTVTIPDLEATLADQNQAIKDFNQSEIDISNELSKQGETRDSVLTRANYEGQSSYNASMIKAQSEASEKKNINYLYIAAGVVVIAIVAYVAYKKIGK